MENFSKLKYRRQFLFTAKECIQLNDWNKEVSGSQKLYVHPDCEFSKTRNSQMDLFLIGFAINPHSPEKSSFEVLEDIALSNAIEDIPNLLHSLTGRFVLIVNLKGKYYFFHDPCGLRQIYYTKNGDELYAASQPLLLNEVIDLKKSTNYEEYFSSWYQKHELEHHLPSGISLYENVFHLVPNHYLDYDSYEQIRYWPIKSKAKLSVEDSVNKISDLLKGTLFAANKRYKLALTLTSGRDSRIMLSAAKEIVDDLYIYTLQYRKLNSKSADIKIPNHLSFRFGFKHHIIDCRKPMNPEFAEIYRQNSDMSHLNDWGEIAHGMFNQYPQDHMAIRGNCIEIGRCPYYNLGKHPKIKSSKFIDYLYAGNQMDFTRKRLAEWYEEVKFIEKDFGYYLYDLYYWELRLGSWQAQSQLEWDIVQEVFAPFNNREIIETMLAVSPEYRSKRRKYLFFDELITNMWNELLLEPINPTSNHIRLKKLIKDTLFYFNIRIRFRVVHYNFWKLTRKFNIFKGKQIK